MKFAFEILWKREGSVEPLFHPAPVRLRSIERARGLAQQFATYFPVHSITIEAEDGSSYERWSWMNETWQQDDLLPATPAPAGIPKPGAGSREAI